MAAAHEAVDSLLGGAAARSGAADGGRARVHRRASGGIGCAAATTGSIATTRAGRSSPTTSRATSATWRPPTGAPASRCSSRSTPSPTRRSRGAAGRAGAPLPRVGHRRPQRAEREAADAGAGASWRPPRRDPRRTVRCHARRPCAVATVRSARSAPTPRDERAASARRSPRSSCSASCAFVVLVAFAGSACPAETAAATLPRCRDGTWSSPSRSWRR